MNPDQFSKNLIETWMLSELHTNLCDYFESLNKIFFCLQGSFKFSHTQLLILSVLHSADLSLVQAFIPLTIPHNNSLLMLKSF